MKRMIPILAVVFCGLMSVMAKTVKVSEFNPDKNDATKAIQAALDSGAEKVIIDKMPFDYKITTIFLRSNQEVVVKDGVTIAAIKGEHKHPTSCLVVADGVKNGILRGEGKALLKMNKKDYQDPNQYSRSEHRHLMPIVNCKNFTLRDITLAASGGDGLYITGKNGDVSSDVLIENVTCTDHHRQGCSIISAERLTIRKCRFINTDGTPPQLGIDFEPNNNSEMLVDCLVEDCYLAENTGGGLAVCVMFTLCKPLSITIRNCVIENNKGGAFGNWTGGNADKAQTGTVRLEKCVFRQPKGTAMNTNNMRAGGVKLKFRDCVFELQDPNGQNFCSVMTQVSDDVDGFDFGNLVVKYVKLNQAFSVASLGPSKFVTPKGNITFKNVKTGENTKFDLSQLEKKYPGNPALRSFKTLVCDTRGMVPLKKRGHGVSGLALRGSNRFLQYGKAGVPMDITFSLPWHRGGINIPVTVTDSNNTPVTNFDITSEKQVFHFVPQYDNVFVFSWSTMEASVNVSSDAPGNGYDCSKGLGMMGHEKDFFFPVMSGTKKVMVELRGDIGEPVGVK